MAWKDPLTCIISCIQSRRLNANEVCRGKECVVVHRVLMESFTKRGGLELINGVPWAELEHNPDSTVSWIWLAATSSLLSFLRLNNSLCISISSSLWAKTGYSSIYREGWDLFLHKVLPSIDPPIFSHCLLKRVLSNSCDCFPPILYKVDIKLIF